MEYQSLVLNFLEQGDFNAEKLKDYQRAFAKQNGMQTLPSKSQILQAYFQLVEEKKINKNSDFELLLRKRSIRSLSGIVSVQVHQDAFSVQTILICQKAISSLNLGQ